MLPFKKLHHQTKKIIVGLSIWILGISLINNFADADELSDLKEQLKYLQKQNESLQEQLDKQRDLAEKLMKRIEALERKDRVLSQQMLELKERPLQQAVKEPLRFALQNYQ